MTTSPRTATWTVTVEHTTLTASWVVPTPACKRALIRGAAWRMAHMVRKQREAAEKAQGAGVPHGQ